MSYKIEISEIRKILMRNISIVLQFLIRVLQFVINFLLSVIDQLLGTIPSLVRANRIISKKILGKYSDELSSDDPRLQLPIEHLKEYFNSEIERLTRIEEKGKSTVAGVTIAITIITGPSVLLPTRLDDIINQPNSIKWSLIVALVLAVVFLLFSGYFSFLAFSVGEISKPLLDDHVSIKEDNQVRKDFIKYIELNSLRIIQRANLLSASMDCLRNGLVLFLFVLIMSLVSILR